MDLKSKLSIYNIQKNNQENISSEEPSVHSSSKEFVSENEINLTSIGAEKINTEHGEIWRIEKRINSEEKYFGLELSTLQKDIRPLLKILKLDEDINLEDLLFFDLETTSLSMGSGNYPFLSGIGYIDGEDFVSEQLFMEKYEDEIPILYYLLDFFNRSKAIVAFNGKTFDVPLIKTRYRLNRVYGFPVKIPVLDLIIPGRRIFKKVYENCALQTFEKHIIGFERVGDIPGWEIPQAYFEFQKNGTFKPIAQILEHNEYDIISMYVLLFLFSKIYSTVYNKNFEELEKQSIFNLAKHFFNVDIEIFLDLAEYLGLEIEEDRNVFEKFSIALKRNNDFQKAITYWESYPSLFSLRELAKYYEHKKNNYSKALKYCDLADSFLDKNIFSEKEKEISESLLENYRIDFKKRKERLIKKSNH